MLVSQTHGPHYTALSCLRAGQNQHSALTLSAWLQSVESWSMCSCQRLQASRGMGGKKKKGGAKEGSLSLKSCVSNWFLSPVGLWGSDLSKLLKNESKNEVGAKLHLGYWTSWQLFEAILLKQLNSKEVGCLWPKWNSRVITEISTNVINIYH